MQILPRSFRAKKVQRKNHLPGSEGPGDSPLDVCQKLICNALQRNIQTQITAPQQLRYDKRRGLNK